MELAKAGGEGKKESKIATSSAAKDGGKNKIVENTSVLYSSPLNRESLLAPLPWEMMN